MGCGDRCETLCREVGITLEECVPRNVSWEDLGAVSRADFVDTCRSDWERERADLSPSFLALALDACEDATDEVRNLECEAVLPLYLAD